MKTRVGQKIKIRFPLNLYFQQLVGHDTDVKRINPFSFWRKYRMNYLETCWAINVVQYLECCLQIECQPVHFQQDNKFCTKSSQTITYRGVCWQKTFENKILVAQPSFELKYRGVTYRTRGIVAINANQAAIKSGLVISNNLAQITSRSK